MIEPCSEAITRNPLATWREGAVYRCFNNGDVFKPWFFEGNALPKKPIKIEIIQEGDERFMLKAYSDGSEERIPIVKLPRKTRYPPRTYRKWDFSKKKGF